MHEAQPGGKIEAMSLVQVFAGGCAEALVARHSDLTLPSPAPDEIREAPEKSHLRRGYLARRGLARRALARRLQCSAEAIAIGRETAGAPLIVAPHCGLHLSISGRDDLAAVAFAEKPVGVDIEPVGAPFEHPLNVMHAAERDLLARLGENAHETFLKLWTAKEAYLKALKTGFGREPSEIEIRFVRQADASGAMHPRGPDVRILDRGVEVPLACGFVQILGYRDRRIALACLVLA